MSPKEKAKQIFDKFMQISISDDQIDYCKDCALIVVNEILNQDKDAFDVTEREYHFGYWYNVKDEIERI